MPGGRPTKYRKSYCQQVIDFMAEGYSLSAFAGEIGVCEDTIYEWRKRHVEFSDAVKKAKKSCAKWWEKLGRAAAAGKVQGFNATAFVWMTKNILKWHDKQEIEHSGKDGKPIEVKVTVEDYTDAD